MKRILYMLVLLVAISAWSCRDTKKADDMEDNIEQMADDAEDTMEEAGEEIEYDVNDYKLHRNMMAFCSAMNIDLS